MANLAHASGNVGQSSGSPPATARHPYLWLNNNAANEHWRGLNLNYYRPLHIAALKGDWESAERFFDTDVNAITARITTHGRTALHVAAIEGHSEFIEKLLQIMPIEALEMKENDDGYTALHYVALAGTTEAAKALVERNRALTQLMDSTGSTPLQLAAVGNYKNKEEVLRNLSLVTTDEDPGRPFTGPQAGVFISNVAHSGFHDITLDLVKRYPNLATARDQSGNCLLRVLAMRPMDFRSGSMLGFWGRCIYPFIPEEVNNSSTTCKVLQWFITISWKAVGFLGFNGIEKVRVTKLRHQCALQLVRLVNEQVSLMNNWQVFEFFGQSVVIPLAAAYGIVEIIRECLLTFPDLIWVNSNLLKVSVIYRQDSIFSLTCEMIARNKIMATRWNDDMQDHILFVAAKLAPIPQLSSISGSALQLQRELQWFKEVEKLVGPLQRVWRNNAGRTAREIFTEEHKELIEQGEKWMKDTSNSCMLVAALIATVVFTAAFTVPGGNNGDKGIPIFLETKSFMVFAISDAVSLFSSSTAILMFMSILTARYAEEDFLKSLPKRMIIGLASLFIAIATMMIAFGAAFSIVMEERIKWIAIPITVLGSFPVALFVMLQLPLFIQMVQLTYGRSFRPQRIW